VCEVWFLICGAEPLRGPEYLHKSAEIASKGHQFNSDVWSVPYHPKARIKAVPEMAAGQSFAQRSAMKRQE